MTKRVLIVGAGHAGGSAAALLRQYGFEGEITLAGDEPLAPYQRPPLSKAWLKGEADGESLLLKPQEFYAEHGIDLRLGLHIAGRLFNRQIGIAIELGQIDLRRLLQRTERRL